jgi:hypothetical protein
MPALLLQSILMIFAQIFLLSLLIKFRPGSFASSSYSVSSGDQPAPSVSTNAPQPVTPPRSAAQSGSEQPQFAFDVVPPSPANEEGAPPNPWRDISSRLVKGGVKGYTPLLDNLNLPPPPILGYQDGEEEEEEQRGNAAARSSVTARSVPSRVARFLKAGFQMGDKKRLDGSSGSRPFGFWTWQTMNSYIIFLVLLIIFLAILQLLFGSFSTYISILGYFALGLESTLPIPQAITNQRRRSLSGFRWSVLLGWLGGDLFKTIYFLVQGSPLQFTVCALFQLSIDFIIAAQMYFFREKTNQDDEEQRLAEAEAMEVGRGRGPVVEEEATLEEAPSGPPLDSSLSTSSHFRIEADDEEDGK